MTTRSGATWKRGASVAGRALGMLAAAGALFASPTAVAAQDDELGEIGIPVGSMAQAVQVEDLDGNAVDLADYIGKGPVLLEFWARWCENCEALQPSLDAAHAEFGDRVTFLAIAVGVAQSQRSVKRHLERHPVPYPVLWDEGGRAVRSFSAPATSYIAVVDASGTVVYTGIGPVQDIDGAIRAGLGEGS